MSIAGGYRYSLWQHSSPNFSLLADMQRQFRNHAIRQPRWLGPAVRFFPKQPLTVSLKRVPKLRMGEHSLAVNAMRRLPELRAQNDLQVSNRDARFWKSPVELFVDRQQAFIALGLPKEEAFRRALLAHRRDQAVRKLEETVVRQQALTFRAASLPSVSEDFVVSAPLTEADLMPSDYERVQKKLDWKRMAAVRSTVFKVLRNVRMRGRKLVHLRDLPTSISRLDMREFFNQFPLMQQHFGVDVLFGSHQGRARLGDEQFAKIVAHLAEQRGLRDFDIGLEQIEEQVEDTDRQVNNPFYVAGPKQPEEEVSAEASADPKAAQKQKEKQAELRRREYQRLKKSKLSTKKK